MSAPTPAFELSRDQARLVDRLRRITMEHVPSQHYYGPAGAAKTLDALREEIAQLRKTMRAVNDNALSWHAGEDGKARALNVIAVWTAEALAGRVHASVATIAESKSPVPEETVGGNGTA